MNKLAIEAAFITAKRGNILAKMTYTWAGNDRIIIDHTEVDDSLRGKGVGKRLVLEAVSFAREQRISIVPRCRFAKSVFV